MAKREIKLTAPQVLVEQTQAYKIYELAVQNYSTEEIAAKLGVTSERIYQIIGEEKKRITVAMEDLRERYQTVTMARMEFWYLKLSEIALSQMLAEPLHGPNKDLFKMMMEVVKFQKEIAMPKNESTTNVEDNSKSIVVNTFSSNTPFYDTALQELQKDINGYTVHKVDSEDILKVPVDERIINLETLASRYLPDGNPFDSDADGGEDQ